MKKLKNAVKGVNNLRIKIQPIIMLILCFIWKVLKKLLKGANNMRKKFQSKVKPALGFIWMVIKKLVKIDIIFFLIGICINAIICKVFPQFSEWFPVVKGWFDGWVQFNLFIVKSFVNGIYSISEGNWSGFRLEFHQKFHELVAQFVEWVNSIKI